MSATRGVIATILLVLFGLTGQRRLDSGPCQGGVHRPRPHQGGGGSRRGHHGFGWQL